MTNEDEDLSCCQVFCYQKCKNLRFQVMEVVIHTVADEIRGGHEAERGEGLDLVTGNAGQGQGRGHVPDLAHETENGGSLQHMCK